MNGQVHRNAGAFFLQGSRDTGVLLIHGYTGAPAEMRMLGNFLQEESGYTVLGVCLTGHCATVEALEQTTWPDWYEAVEEGVKELHRHCRHIYIAGQSMGGLLAIKAAAEFSAKIPFEPLSMQGNGETAIEKATNDYSVEKLILLATPVFLQDWRVPFVKLLRYFIPRLHTGQHSYNVPEEYMQGYTEMPTKPVPSLLELIELCKADYLGKINIPTLIVQGNADHTVKPHSATYIYEQLKQV
ncbi:MAG: hypothetical protein II419_04225, partial [Acidaminococcaceae bacterium]|nr:hypothetical protein [Acidaminococcaceae bacterium]